MSKPLDQAVEELRAISDPYARLREARRLDDALLMARQVVAMIKRDTVESLRGGADAGYGGIARRIGLSKARVQQIANTERVLPAAFAFLDAEGTWWGEPHLPGRCEESRTAIPFSPADEDNPHAGQVLLVRWGNLPENHGISSYTVQVTLDDGSPMNLRMTQAVLTALFGPTTTGTPEWDRWVELKRQAAERKRSGGS